MSYSTKAIFGKRAMERISADAYIDWAGEMLLQGYDTFNLRILAGLNRRGSVFEVEDYFSRSIKELNLIEPEPQAAIKAYACELAQQIILGQLTAPEGVRSLYQICLAAEYAPELIVWYELDEALDSLLAGAYPYTYPGVSRESFNTIVRQEAERFLNEVCKSTSA